MEVKDINTGDVLLVSSSSWLSSTIQDFQNCKWNHAGLFLWIENQLYVCEAHRYGVRLKDFSAFINGNSQLMILKPVNKYSSTTKEYMIHFCLPYCGNAPYDFMSLVIHQPIKFLFGKWIGKKVSEASKRFTCGEWVMFVYYHFTGWFENWYKHAPVDLYNSVYFTRHLYK